MQVADRFANHKSTYDLPSSAQVLALLAASDADDATVQQSGCLHRTRLKATPQKLGWLLIPASRQSCREQLLPMLCCISSSGKPARSALQRKLMPTPPIHPTR
jgi:hypothetical protein